jgi:hypothetical protein
MRVHGQVNSITFFGCHSLNLPMNNYRNTHGQMPVDVEDILYVINALRSLFSPSKDPWPLESNVIAQGLHLLDISTSFPPAQLSLKFVSAWVLRALYLRCTTRPHLSWMASCDTLYIAEAIGLHQELNNLDVLEKRKPDVLYNEAKMRRKTFWAALSLNRLFSMNYGRTSLTLDWVTCSADDPSDQFGSVAEFPSLCQLLPLDVNSIRNLAGRKEILVSCLQELAAFEARCAPLALLRAEI